MFKYGLKLYQFRIGWAAVSDRIGRWNTFQGFTLVAAPIFAISPFLINNCVMDPTGHLDLDPFKPCLNLNE